MTATRTQRDQTAALNTVRYASRSGQNVEILGLQDHVSLRSRYRSPKAPRRPRGYFLLLFVLFLCLPGCIGVGFGPGGSELSVGPIPLGQLPGLPKQEPYKPPKTGNKRSLTPRNLPDAEPSPRGESLNRINVDEIYTGVLFLIATDGAPVPRGSVVRLQVSHGPTSKAYLTAIPLDALAQGNNGQSFQFGKLNVFADGRATVTYYFPLGTDCIPWPHRPPPWLTRNGTQIDCSAASFAELEEAIDKSDEWPTRFHAARECLRRLPHSRQYEIALKLASRNRFAEVQAAAVRSPRTTLWMGR